jgi:mono/diheme cytochrome c family protein
LLNLLLLNGATANGADSISKGRALFLGRGCAACHTVDGGPSRFGPRLEGISSRRTQQELEEALRSGYDEPEMIRTLHLSSAEMQNIIDFLNSLPSAKLEKASSHKPRFESGWSCKKETKMSCDIRRSL